MANFHMTWNGQYLPDCTLPDGFSLRTYRPGDEAGWLACCSAGSLGTETWDAERFHREMLERAGIVPEGIFLS